MWPSQPGGVNSAWPAAMRICPGGVSSGADRRRGVTRPADLSLATVTEPDTTHGEPRERTEAFRLKAVVPLAPPGKPPYRTNDPHLTPELPGVTDKEH